MLFRSVLPAKLAPAEIIGKVKANSSGWVHKTFPARQTFAWQVGYAAFGVSPSQKQIVLDYIPIRRSIIAKFRSRKNSSPS